MKQCHIPSKPYCLVAFQCYPIKCIEESAPRIALTVEKKLQGHLIQSLFLSEQEQIIFQSNPQN